MVKIMNNIKLVTKCLNDMIKLVKENPEYFSDDFDDDIISMAKYCIRLLESR